MSAELLMLLGGAGAFLVTLYGVRSRDLREKYAVMWLGVAILVLLGGIFPKLIKSFAESAHLSYAVAMLFIALGAIYIFSFSVSVSLTRQYRRNVRLTQELAIMEQRVRQLEAVLCRAQKSEGEKQPAPSPVRTSEKV